MSSVRNSYSQIQEKLQKMPKKEKEDIEKYCSDQASVYMTAASCSAGVAFAGALSIFFAPELAVPEILLGGIGAVTFGKEADLEYKKCVRKEVRKFKM